MLRRSWTPAIAPAAFSSCVSEPRKRYFAGPWHTVFSTSTSYPPKRNALHAVFKPTKVNYGAYGDTGHHLHFHLVPKYADDAFEWGGVFEMNPRRKFLPDAEYAALIAAIRSAL